jgi:hypothetical protein
MPPYHLGGEFGGAGGIADRSHMTLYLARRP